MKKAGVLLIAALAGCGSTRIKDAQEIAAHDLADPAAVQFRDVEKAGDHCVTGELNAKNRMGAYTGFRPFVVDLRKRQVAIMPDDRGDADTEIATARVKIFKMDCGL